jgi:hypothetical protein
MNFRMIRFQFIITMTLAYLPAVVEAQLNKGGIPHSFSLPIAPDTGNYVMVDPPSGNILSMEDQQSPVPYRYAINVAADLTTGNSGKWLITEGGIRVWRLNVKSPGALGLILYFDRFRLPEGGKLFVYNPRRTQLLGAFTSLNNNDLSTFATSLIYGDELTLEYNAPDGLALPDLHLSEVGHAYRGVADRYRNQKDFGSAGPCHVNVNCPEGSNWAKEKRSVVRISVKRPGSSVWCTGMLVNNVRNNGIPYVITANHCGSKSSETDLSQWLFYFNYESAGCPDPTIEPPIKSMTGAKMLAHTGYVDYTGSDFFLVLLDSAIPDSFNVYFSGWSRESEQPSQSGVGIHHPWGDVKKISTYSTPLQPAYWGGNPDMAFWRVTWSETVNGHGTTEKGSSGSPLFDDQGRMVGTLTGGDSSCDSAKLNLPDYYGMFSYHWDQNGTDSASILKCWLDPDNKGVMQLNGWAVSVQEPGDRELASLFPNPVKDFVNIHLSGFAGKNLQVSILDILGKLRIKCDWDPRISRERQLDMTGFAPGVYLLVMADGEHRMVRKIIKE